MNAIYITAFNSPDRCESLMKSLSSSGIGSSMDRILMNQSDEEFMSRYNELCVTYGWENRVKQNNGATASKWSVIMDASSGGYEFFSQISEDFVMCHNEQKVPWLPPCPTFLKDCLTILNERKHLTFIHWSFITGQGSALVLDPHKHPANLTVKKVIASNLAHCEGDVRLLNWPFTARTKRIATLLNEVDKADLGTLPDGGESRLAELGFGTGGVLLALPAVHIRHSHERPPGSKP